MATIQKRGSSYSIRVSCGYDLSRRQIVRCMTWRPPEDLSPARAEREAQRQAALFEERCRAGQVLHGGVRFADFAAVWMRDYAAGQVRPTTYARYQTMLPRILAALGHLRLDRIQPHHLLAFYAGLAEPGVRRDGRRRFRGSLHDTLLAQGMIRAGLAERAGVSRAVVSSILAGGNVSERSARRLADCLGRPVDDLFEPVSRACGLSQKTILHHHRLLSVIFETAVRWQVIAGNPCSRIQPPRTAHLEARYLDEEQASRLLCALEHADLQHRTMIYLLLYTGMRRGELCGLHWDDVDLPASVIHIRRSALYLPGHGLFEDDTKNPSSRRSIKVPQDAMRLLADWYDAQRPVSGAHTVFRAAGGGPVQPDTVTAWFSRFLRKHDLPPVPLHALRHTNATLLIAAGANLQTVAARLGHASITTTGRIYAHAIQSADAHAAETLQDLLHPLAGKKTRS